MYKKSENAHGPLCYLFIVLVENCKFKNKAGSIRGPLFSSDNREMNTHIFIHSFSWIPNLTTDPCD